MRFQCEKLLAFAWHSAVVLIVLSTFLVTVVAQEPVTLRPGIVVDPGAKTVYVMTPDGISAIDLTSGEKRWTTKAAAKPLGLAGNRLISQIEPKRRTSTLELATLNTSARGTLIAYSEKELPDEVRVGIGQTLEGRFETEVARMDEKDATVKWSFERRPLQGRRERGERDGDDVEVPRTLNMVSQGSSRLGAFSVDLASGAVSPAPANLAASTATDAGARAQTERRMRDDRLYESAARVSDAVGAAASADLARSTKAVSSVPPAYESKDKRHMMVSERVTDDDTWAKYRWTVYDKDGIKRLGDFRTHLAFAPFVVKNSILMYETTPYIKDGKAEPAKLHGINLETGQEIWSVEVRENVFRGPFPP